MNGIDGSCSILRKKLSKMVASIYIPSNLWYPRHTISLETFKLELFIILAILMSSSVSLWLKFASSWWVWAALICLLAFWITSVIKCLIIFFCLFFISYQYFYWFGRSSLCILNTHFLLIKYVLCKISNVLWLDFDRQNFKFHFSKFFHIAFKLGIF